MYVSNFLQFINSKVEVSPEMFKQGIGSHEELIGYKLLVYNDIFYIQVLDINSYYLMFENKEFKSSNLFLLEMMLWDSYAKHELHLSDEQQQADFAMRDKSMAKTLGQPQKYISDLDLSNYREDDLECIQYFIQITDSFNARQQSKGPTMFSLEEVTEIGISLALDKDYCSKIMKFQTHDKRQKLIKEFLKKDYQITPLI